jgi:hypothetical protein
MLTGSCIFPQIRGYHSHLAILLHLLLRPVSGVRELAWVYEEESKHKQRHQSGVENVQKVLVSKQEAVVSHQIFHDTENGPYHDETGPPIQSLHVSAPDRDLRLQYSHSLAVVASMENSRNHDEQAEKCDLEEETDNDDLFTSVQHG